MAGAPVVVTGPPAVVSQSDMPGALVAISRS